MLFSTADFLLAIQLVYANTFVCECTLDTRCPLASVAAATPVKNSRYTHITHTNDHDDIQVAK